MTPKEKAQNLFDLHFDYVQAVTSQGQIDNAKECALITVNEMIIYLNEIMLPNPFTQYLNEVKTEIKKIEI